MKDPFEEAAVDVDRRGAAIMLVVAVALMVGVAVASPRLRDIFLIIGGIVVMVMLHEFGHYFTAKRAGMKATEFFVGFGPRLWSFRRGETEFGVKAILLGGYVRILGMSNLEQPEQDPETGEWRHDFRPEDEPRTFRRGSYGNRLIVVLAGVTVNILLAFVLFWAVLAGNGVSEATTTVRTVTTDSAAQAAGVEKGDRIVAVDGQPIDGWEELKAAIEARGGEETSFTVIRDGVRVALVATVGEREGQGFLGVGPTSRHVDIGFFEAIPESFETIGDITVGTVEGIGRIFSPEGVEEYSKNFTDNAPKAGSAASDARPRSLIGIVDAGSDIVNGNVWALLWLLGGISLVLALFNLLPVLPFDGGHAVIVGYEWIASKVTRRRVQVDYRKLMPVAMIVLVLFLTLGLSAMFLDIREAVGN